MFWGGMLWMKSYVAIGWTVHLLSLREITLAFNVMTKKSIWENWGGGFRFVIFIKFLLNQWDKGSFLLILACFCQRNWNQSHQQMDTDPTETTGHCPEVSRSSVPHQRQQVRHAYLRVRQQLRSTQDLHFWGRTCKICFHEVCWKYWILTQIEKFSWMI